MTMPTSISYPQLTLSSRFQVGFVNWPDEEHMRPFFLGRVKGRFEIPGTVMYKAVEDSGRIAGFIALTEEEEKAEEKATANGQSGAKTVKVGEEAVKPKDGTESTPVAPAPNGTIPSNGTNGSAYKPPEYDENGRLKFDPDEIQKKTGTGQYFKTQDNGKMVLPDYLNQDLMLGVRDSVRPMMDHIANQGKHYCECIRPFNPHSGIQPCSQQA